MNKKLKNKRIYLDDEISKDITKLLKRAEKNDVSLEYWDFNIGESVPDEEETEATLSLILGEIAPFIPQYKKNADYINALLVKSPYCMKVVAANERALNFDFKIENVLSNMNEYFLTYFGQTSELARDDAEEEVNPNELERLQEYNEKNEITFQRNDITYTDIINWQGKSEYITDDIITQYTNDYNTSCYLKYGYSKKGKLATLRLNTIERLVSRICDINRFNPIKRFFDDLPELDLSENDYIGELLSIISESDNPMTDIIFRKFAYQCYALGTEDIPSGADASLVLFSEEQGTGKSLFASLFFCPEYIAEHYDFECFKALLGFNPNIKDKIIESTGYWGAEVSELGASLTPKTLNNFKTFLTIPNDEFRVPYGRHSIKRPRRLNLICTTNDSRFLIDDKDRRFYIIETRKRSFAEALLKFNEEGKFLKFWAQVKKEAELVKANHRKTGSYIKYYSLKPEERDILVAENQKHRKPSNAEYILSELFDEAEENPNLFEWGFYRITDLRSESSQVYADRLRNEKDEAIQRAIRKLNNNNIQHTKHGQKYYFPLPKVQHN